MIDIIIAFANKIAYFSCSSYKRKSFRIR